MAEERNEEREKERSRKEQKENGTRDHRPNMVYSFLPLPRSPNHHFEGHSRFLLFSSCPPHPVPFFLSLAPSLFDCVWLSRYLPLRPPAPLSVAFLEQS